MTLGATADGAGCQKGREMQASSFGRPGFPGVLFAHQPHSCLTPPPSESSVHHHELLSQQLPEPASSFLPLIHRETPSLLLQNLLTAFRTCCEQLQMLCNNAGPAWHPLCVLHDSKAPLTAKTQLSTQHTDPGIMLITKSFLAASRSGKLFRRPEKCSLALKYSCTDSSLFKLLFSLLIHAVAPAKWIRSHFDECCLKWLKYLMS